MGTVLAQNKKFRTHAKASKYWKMVSSGEDETIKYVYNNVLYPDRRIKKRRSSRR